MHAHLSGALRQADVMPLAAMAAAAAAAEQRLRGLQAGAPGGGPAGAGASAEPARAAPAGAVDPGLLPALQAALRCAQRTGCASRREGSLRVPRCRCLPWCHGAPGSRTQPKQSPV